MDFDQRIKLVHLKPGVLLGGVPQQVGHDGLVVGNVSAQGDGDGLAEAMLRDGNSSIMLTVARLEEIYQSESPNPPAKGAVSPQSHDSRSNSKKV